MMNLVSRCSERTPDVLASTASESLGKTRHESQLPLSSWNEQHQRTGRPAVDAYSSSYSEWNADKKWSSQEWKSDELTEVRTGRLVNEQPPGLFTQHTDKFIVDADDMDSDTVAESDMSLLSWSFLHRVNDRVRKIQDQSSKDATLDSNTHSLLWGMYKWWEAAIFVQFVPPVWTRLFIVPPCPTSSLRSVTLKFDVFVLLESWHVYNPGDTVTFSVKVPANLDQPCHLRVFYLLSVTCLL